jgi:hypothetical protein
MKLNDFISYRENITETIKSNDFKKILKVFLPIAKKIIQLDRMPEIILRKTIHDEQQPTMGRFNNETYSLELAIANRQPVDALRTLAHELVHAKQNEEHVNIDPTTGSPEENQANELAGIVMREFNKMHPEFLKLQPVQEGGNLAVGGHEAQQIDLKVHQRNYIVPVLDKVLHAINTSFAQSYKAPLWKPALLQSRKFLSGSSLHFFNTDISDDEFVAKKPKVGDIDTQVDKNQEQNLEAFLTSVQGKMVGPAKCLGFSRGNEQFSSLWELQNPPIKVQIDLEFVAYEKDEPTQWAQFSHSSSWEDLNAGIKGVFHKYMMRSLTANSATQKYVARQLKKGVKISDEPVVDNNLSFAVSSKQGGGMRTKYVPYNNPATGKPMMKNGIPVMLQVAPGDSEYVQDLGQQYQMLFGQLGNEADQKLMWSFLGIIQLANKYLQDDARNAVAMAFEELLFGRGAQGLYKGDPKRDQQEKMVALSTMVKQLKGIDGAGVINKAKADAQTYYSTYKGTDESVSLAEAIGEAGDDAPVKAQLRKGMPHLKDLKPADLLDLIDELHQGNGQFKLQNIPLNVKVDGFGGRFGKSADGRPFMGTSNTPPRFEAGFVKYHQQKGTTDPDILGRAQLFDDLFKEMMHAIQMVDSKLGKDFLVNKQVTCEVLFLPFATQTPEGKLKFVGIHYDKLPDGVQLALVPFRVVNAESGEDLPDANKVVKALTGIGREGSVMFIDNSLTQNDALDVTAIVPPLENIEQIKSMLASGKLAQKREAKEILAPVALALEKAIINDPNIVGKDLLGKDYEGIVINSRLGPIKITSQEQRNVIAAKMAAKASARQERPRENTNKTAVVAIGSFVGHIGHEQLWDYTIKKAQQVGGDPYLFIGNAEGKDDPIPPSVKVQTWHKMYPEYTKNISTVTQQGGSLMQKIKHELINPLPGKPPRYDNIIIMVGEDQANMNIAQALMKAVNKFQGYEHVKVNLEVTPRGTGMSFTKLRNILKDPNATPEQQYQTWAQGFDEQKLGKDWILHLMDLTRKGMGIQQPKQQQAVPQPEKVSEPAVEGIGPMDTPLRRFMIKQIARITGRDDLENLDDNEIENLFAKYVPGSEKKIEKFNHAMQEFSALEYQDRMAGVGMGNYVVDETQRMSARVKLQRAWDRERAKSDASRDRMRRELELIANPPKKDEPKKDDQTNERMAPVSQFAGTGAPTYYKLGRPAQLRNQKRGARAGDLVGGDSVQNTDKPVEEDEGDKEGLPHLTKELLTHIVQQVGKEGAHAIVKSLEWGDGAAKELLQLITKDLKNNISMAESVKQRLDPKCWKGYRKAGTKMKGGTRVNNCVKVGEGWETEISNAVNKLLENFADGKNPGRKGLAKRSGVNTKASVSDLRKTAKHSTGEKARMAHWLANMKAGKAKK